MITSDHQLMWGSLSLARPSSRGETVSGKCIVHCSHFVLWACSTQLAIPVHLLAGMIITEGHIMDTSWKGLVRHLNNTFQVYVSLPGILYTNEAEKTSGTSGCIYIYSIPLSLPPMRKDTQKVILSNCISYPFCPEGPGCSYLHAYLSTALYLFPELATYGHCIRQIVACCVAVSKASLVP